MRALFQRYYEVQRWRIQSFCRFTHLGWRLVDLSLGRWKTQPLLTWLLKREDLVTLHISACFLLLLDGRTSRYAIPLSSNQKFRTLTNQSHWARSSVGPSFIYVFQQEPAENLPSSRIRCTHDQTFFRCHRTYTLNYWVSFGSLQKTRLLRHRWL